MSGAKHALFFVFDGPYEGKEGQVMEVYEATKKFWRKRQQAGDIESVTFVTLASTRNADMPAGFCLVVGDRARLQQIRWDDEEFLNIHMRTMTGMRGYACIDGYANDGNDEHMARFRELMQR